MGNYVRKVVSGKVAATSCFLLVKPGKLGNAGEIATTLKKCKGVKEVHLTSGRYGFIVAANATLDEELNDMSAKIKRIANSRSVSVAVSHLTYR